MVGCLVWVFGNGSISDMIQIEGVMVLCEGCGDCFVTRHGDDRWVGVAGDVAAPDGEGPSRG